MQLIRKQSWISGKLCLRHSHVHGQGIFALSPIASGEILIIWGGTVFTVEEVRNGEALQHTNVGISETHLLGSSPLQELTIDDYMNHSCTPNVSMRDATTIVARHGIDEGVEIVADYAMWLNDPMYQMKNLCTCGSERCRYRITGEDWRLEKFIEFNYGHASPFVNERIRVLKGWSA
jgi:SET domain-containing protein